MIKIAMCQMSAIGNANNAGQIAQSSPYLLWGDTSTVQTTNATVTTTGATMFRHGVRGDVSGTVLTPGIDLTMRLSDARLRRRTTNLIYPDHRNPHWPTEDAPRDRSNRLLGGICDQQSAAPEFVERNTSGNRPKYQEYQVIPKEMTAERRDPNRDT